MTLSDAITKILELDNYENMSNSQIYSILSDYGVFKEFPNLRLVVKIALDYGYWDLITKNPNTQQISIFKAKLDKDGFSKSVIKSLFFFLEKKDKDTQDKNNQYSHFKELKSKIISKSTNRISFLGLELGCKTSKMKNWLIKKGYIETTKDGKRITFNGRFLGVNNAEIVLWETEVKTIWSVVVKIKVNLNLVKPLFDKKYDFIKTECFIKEPKYIYKDNGGTIDLSFGERSKLTRICYTDSETYKLNEIAKQENIKIRKQKEEERLKNLINSHEDDI